MGRGGWRAQFMGSHESDTIERLHFLSRPQYSVPQTELRGRVLSLSVWHHESLGRNIFLGEVEVPLDTWDWDSEPTWLPLQPRVSSWPTWGDPGPDLPPLSHRAFPQSPSPSKP